MKAKGNQISPSEGWKMQLGHKGYLSSLGNTSYEETFAHLGTYWSSFTPDRHALYWAINGSYAPLLNNTFFATSTLQALSKILMQPTLPFCSVVTPQEPLWRETC